MTEQEIEDMKKELILLRMHKKRLEEDIQKLQLVIKDILIGEITKDLPLALDSNNSEETATEQNT